MTVEAFFVLAKVLLFKTFAIQEKCFWLLGDRVWLAADVVADVADG
jgi:hypothetical protein